MKSKSSLHLYLAFLIFITLIYIYILQRMINFKYLDKEPEVHGWERTKSRNTSKYIKPNQETAFLSPQNVCMKQIFLRILVVSDVRNFHRRKIIRETWGNETTFGYDTFHTRIHRQARRTYLNRTDLWKGKQIGFKVYFVLGRDVSERSHKYQKLLQTEAKMYNDILQEDFIEHYANLTLKSLFILKWASKPCMSHSTKFFAKVDDDIFLNVPNLMHVLLGGTIPAYKALKYFYDDMTIDVMNNKNRLIKYQKVLMGDLWNLTPSLRDAQLKHYSPRYLYEPTFYPPFLSGYTFIMSSDVARVLYDQALKTPIFHLEDVFVTGIVAHKAQIRRKRHNLFSFKRLSEEDMCGLKGIVAENGRDPKDFRKALDFVLDEKVKCETMIGRWVVYVYKGIYNIFEPWISIWNNYKYWFPPKR